MARIIDIKMRINNDWNEYTNLIGSDMRMCEDLYALWQAFEGELKTRQGDVNGIGLTTYGSRLYTLLGENLTNFTPDEAVSMIQEVSRKYSFIKNILVLVDPIDWGRGKFTCKITLTTNFGKITEQFHNEGDC